MISVDLISSFFPFDLLNHSKLKKFISISTVCEYKNGEVIYNEGDEADYFYLLLKGKIIASVKESDKSVVLEEISKGTSFGIISLLTGDKHSVTVTSLNTSSVLKVAKKDFDDFLKKNPVLAFEFSKVLSKRVKKRVFSPKFIFESNSIGLYLSQISQKTVNFVLDLTSKLETITKKKLLIIEFNSRNLAKQFQYPDSKESFSFEKDIEDYGQYLAFSDNLDYLSVDNLPQVDGKLVAVDNFFSQHYHFIFYVFSNSSGFAKHKDLFLALNELYFVSFNDNLHLQENYKFLHDIAGKFSYRGILNRIICNSSQDFSSQKHNFFHSLKDNPYIRLNYDKQIYQRQLQHLARQFGGKTFGVVLSSGGAFGFSHIGVMKVLSEHNIPIDMICGSSMGSVISALWACGFDLEQIIEKVSFLGKKLKSFSYSGLSLPFRGFFKSKKLEKVFKKIFEGKTFEDTKYPLSIVVFNFKQREINVIRHGPIYKAISASCAMPGVFEPIVMRDTIFLDGGVLSPLPTKVLVANNIKNILAVNVTPSIEEINREYEQKKLLKFNIFDYIFGSIETMQQEFIKVSLELADLVIHPDLSGMHWLEFDKVEQFVKRGEDAARNRIDDILKLISE